MVSIINLPSQENTLCWALVILAQVAEHLCQNLIILIKFLTKYYKGKWLQVPYSIELRANLNIRLCLEIIFSCVYLVCVSKYLICFQGSDSVVYQGRRVKRELHRARFPRPRMNAMLRLRSMIVPTQRGNHSWANDFPGYLSPSQPWFWWPPIRC